MKKTQTLRKGYTTGACAAAATKAAAQALFASLAGKTLRPESVSVTLPRGGALSIPVKAVEVNNGAAKAVIIKDAGDDPDVTDGAEFVSEVRLIEKDAPTIEVDVKGGKGVGVVTKRGLKVAIGNPAINPVPMEMIKTAFTEASAEAGLTPRASVTITVPMGEELAKKTMNPRLGIMGGISILGTTGIVEPMSLVAYTHSISCAVDVALAGGLDEVVFSTGRSSEKVVEETLKLPEEAFVLTGDHMGFALRDAKGRPGLKRVTVAGQFGKFTKLACGHFETHCNDSSVELEFLAALCAAAGADARFAEKVKKANTAREVFFILKDAMLNKVFEEIVKRVRDNSKKIVADKEVKAILVGYDGVVVAASE